MIEKSAPLRTSFIRNFGYSAIARVVQMIFGFLIIGYVVKSVGIEKWGILTVSVSLVNIISVLQSSISGAAGKKLTDYYVKNDIEGFNRHYLATTYLTLIVCAIVLLMVVACEFFFIFSLMSEGSEELGIVFLLTGMNVLLQILALPGLAILQATNKIEFQAKSVIFGFIIRILLVFSIFVFSKTIIVYSVILVLESLAVTLAIYFSIGIKIRIKPIPTIVPIDKTYYVGVIKFNSLNFLHNLNYVLFLQIPMLIIARKYGLVYSGYYGIGLQFYSLVRGMISPVTSALAPLFNFFRSAGDEKRLKGIYQLSSKLFSISALLILTLFQFFAADLLPLWLGDQAPELAIFVVKYSWFISIGVFFVPSAFILVTLEKLKETSLMGFSMAMLAAFILLLFKPTDYAILVIALAMSIPFFVYNLQKFIITIRILGFKSWEFVLPFVYILSVSLIVAFSEGFFNGFTFFNKILTLFVVILLSVVIINREEWKSLKQLILRSS